jgi:hypothetical protein
MAGIKRIRQTADGRPLTRRPARDWWRTPHYMAFRVPQRRTGAASGPPRRVRARD